MSYIKLLQSINELKTLVRKNFINNKEVLTAKELQDYLGLSESTLYKLTSKKLIPHHKPTGGALFFFKEEIHTWIKKHRIYTEEDALDLLGKQVKRTLKNRDHE